MDLNVGRILKLLWDPGIGRRRGNLFGPRNRTFDPFFARRQFADRALGCHDLTPFDRHGVGHDQNQLVAFERGHHRQADPRVARGRFNDHAARLEDPARFGIFNHREPNAIFNAAPGIGAFQLQPHFVGRTIARAGNLPQSLADHRRLAQCAVDAGAELLLFPELSLTGYDRGLTPADAIAPTDARLQACQTLADSHGILISVGAPIASSAGLHIGAFNFVPSAGIQVYLKRYLHEGEEVAFTAGQGGAILTRLGQTVSLAICAEITHPAHAQAAADAGTTLYAASCFITPQGYAHDAGLLQGYARAHGMAILLANYGAPTGGWEAAGRSAIWDKNGNVLAVAPERGEALITAAL